MPYVARHRFARISPRKAQEVARLIRGRWVDEALNLLRFSPKRAARIIEKVVRSAVAGAEEKDADVTTLYVAEARVDTGPTLKRWEFVARGMVHPRRRRTCHITVVLDEGE